MSRAWFFALAASIGLNAGLLWVHFTGGPLRPPPGPPFGGRPGGPPAGAPLLAPERLAERHVARLAAELDLTDEQRAALTDLMRERVPRLVEFRERILEARGDVADAYRSRQLDGHRFRAFVATLRGVQAGLDSLTTEIMLKEAEVLTPEQRERYLEVMPWSLDGPGGPGVRGGPPGGPPGAGPPGGGPPPRRRPRGGI